MKFKVIVIVLFIFSLLSLNLCKQNDVVDNKENTEEPEIGVNVGDIATAFTEIDLSNITINLEDMKGKVIMLNFSAMWCGPCRLEAGELMEIYNKYKERGFELIQCIYQDEDGRPADNDDLKRWRDEFGLTFAIVSDPDSSTVNTYKVRAIPTNLIIDRDFIIKYKAEGFDKAVVENIISSNL